MIRTNNVRDIKFEKDQIVIFTDNKSIKISLQSISPKLLKASEVERNLFKISHSGYGIHWPLIDEDISIDAILKEEKKI